MSKNDLQEIDNNNSALVLEVLANQPEISQREISENVGLSVGLINLIIKRLTKTGYIKVTNIHHKRAGYYLTSTGIRELSRRSYNYLNRTVKTYQNLLNRIKQLINELVEKGHKKFVLVGKGEVTNLVSQSLSELSDSGITWRQVSNTNRNKIEPDEFILDTRFRNDSSTTGISFLNKLIGQYSSKGF